MESYACVVSTHTHCHCICSVQYGAKACVRDGRGAQRSRVRSTRDETPVQPARALSVYRAAIQIPPRHAQWRAGVVAWARNQAGGTGTPNETIHSVLTL